MVQFSEEATADLENIYETIAVYNPALAQEKIDGIQKVCALIDTRQTMGMAVSGTENGRRFSTPPWIIYYRPGPTGIFVYRVFHSRQDWRALI